MTDTKEPSKMEFSNVGASPTPHWTTPQMRNNLEALLVDAKAQASGRIMQQTEQGRIMSMQHVRLLETLLHGAPQSELPKQHHG